MNKKIFLFSLALAMLSAVGAKAQVTMGAIDAPQNFSILELISNNTHGLRLPQLTQLQRDTLDGTVASTGGSAAMVAAAAAFDAERTGKAEGLQIFNTTTKCVETWNGTVWIQSCNGEPASPPTFTLPSGYKTWTTNFKWVGAFWRQDQTGERVIASASDTYWKAEVYDPSVSGSWLTLQAGGSNDPALWSASPGDAEDYQLPTTQTAEITGSGNILFRIGARSVNPNGASSDYKIYDATTNTTVNGKQPRYAKVLVRTGASAGTYNTCDTIFCRQGEAADYVYTPEYI